MKTSDKLLNVDTHAILASLKLHDRTFNRATVDSRAKHRLVMPFKVEGSIREKMSYPVLLRTVTKLMASDMKKVIHMGDVDSSDPLLRAFDGSNKRGWAFSDTNILLNDFTVKKSKVHTPHGDEYLYIISIRVGIEHSAVAAEHAAEAENL